MPGLPDMPTAAIVTVGSELLDGIGLDTNTREIAEELTRSGYRVMEASSVPDDPALLASALRRLTGAYSLVVCTGGLGPTHDDVTREAASAALGLPLSEDPALRALLEPVAARHARAEAHGQVFSQALVLEGAQVISATSGTAPGQIVPTRGGTLALLPGPPHEMRPMLDAVLDCERRSPVRILGCVGISESDAQVAAQRVLAGSRDIDLTVLATPGHVRVVLVSRGAEEAHLEDMAHRIANAIGDRCYTVDGEDLAAAVLSLALRRGVQLALAESCTGGLVASRITEVPGSSAAFAGAVVAYSNRAKADLLEVAEDTLSAHGAVSAEVAEQMARGACARFGADLAVSVTGVAGPDGGSADKPVGLVWFGIAGLGQTVSVRRNLYGDRHGIRERASVTALDLLRRRLAGLEVD